MGEEAVLPGGCFRGEDWGVGKYGLFQDFFAGGAVKACPGIAPGVGGVGAVVDGVHGADEKGVACFQMVGVAAALVDAFAVEDHVEKVVWAHGRAEGVVRTAVFLAAEVDGEGVLGLGFFGIVFHLGGLLFLGYSTKTQFWVTKWDGMLYEVIIQYWVWEGQGNTRPLTMYITEDLVIEVVSGIFIEANAKMHSYLMILKERGGYFYPQ